MSVDRKLVIIYGIKGEYEKFATKDEATKNTKYIVPDSCYSYEQSPDMNNLILFTDGMNGEYSFLGYLLFVDNMEEWGDDAYFSIDLEMLHKITNNFDLDAFRLSISKEDRAQAKLHTFFHYH